MKKYLFFGLSMFAAIVCAHAKPASLQADAEPVTLPQINALFDGRCALPSYPPEAAQKNQAGTVVVSFYVGKNGRAIDTRVAPSSGFSLLDAASIDAVNACDKFQSGIAYGKPIELLVTVEYEWRVARKVTVRPILSDRGPHVVYQVGTPVIPASLNVAACKAPTYPLEAARNEWQGEVILAFLVGVDGNVVASKIERSSGHQVLDEQARTFLAACRHFKPAIKNGKPAEAWARVAYVWKLE